MTRPDATLATGTAVDRLMPGPASICSGFVHHRRTRPASHAFTHRVSMIWIDPDRPGDVFDRHPLWSARHVAPYRFRRQDYGPADDTTPLGVGVRRDLADALGSEPGGAVRMLTQPRAYGWLFNPITLYLAWEDDAADPVGVIAEVTNTPWKERHRYAAALRSGSPQTADFDKVLHVSPFLDSELRYHLAIAADARGLEVAIDVHDLHDPSLPPILTTSLQLERRAVDRGALTTAMTHNPFPTHRVSAHIHREALALWRKRVPFVAHPDRRAEQAQEEPSCPLASRR